MTSDQPLRVRLSKMSKNESISTAAVVLSSPSTVPSASLGALSGPGVSEM